MNPLDRLRSIRDKEERTILGLSSGTSADGVDALLVKVRGNGLSLEAEPILGRTFPYQPGLRDTIRALGGGRVSEICKMNFIIGEIFAKNALALIGEAGLEPDQVELVGSHGQTVFHIPRGPRASPSTLQIGEPDVIAEKTQVPVIADFRTRDVAAGGDGAPLVPYVDFLLFRNEGGPLAIQNIGGIANVTVVTEDFESVFAFDTGPGNMPIDHVVSVLTRGAETFDPGGRHAVRGRVDNNLLDKLLTHPYLRAEPPKSTGREAFGQDWVMGILESKGNSSVLDVLATVTFFVARSIHQAYEDFVFPRSEVREVVVSGGGLRNLALMAHLRRLFQPVPVRSVEDHGYSSDLKEALAFAILANETLFGNPNNVPAATGAKWPVVLGKICP